ncbi:MAG: hypothetical protein HY052_05875 [Proteobacteria bacterium]|nr:hypothetical protein [Pseudomonadota bacterium]
MDREGAEREWIQQLQNDKPLLNEERVNEIKHILTSECGIRRGAYIECLDTIKGCANQPDADPKNVIREALGGLIHNETLKEKAVQKILKVVTDAINESQAPTQTAAPKNSRPTTKTPAPR